MCHADVPGKPTHCNGAKHQSGVSPRYADVPWLHARRCPSNADRDVLGHPQLTPMGGRLSASPDQSEIVLHGAHHGALGAGLLDAAEEDAFFLQLLLNVDHLAGLRDARRLGGANLLGGHGQHIGSGHLEGGGPPGGCFASGGLRGGCSHGGLRPNGRGVRDSDGQRPAIPRRPGPLRRVQQMADRVSDGDVLLSDRSQTPVPRVGQDSAHPAGCEGIGQLVPRVACMRLHVGCLENRESPKSGCCHEEEGGLLVVGNDTEAR
eukprot:5034978-Lingulodinium_polyedra.AAC.1